MSERITREQAIEELSILLNKWQDSITGDALDMAIKALEKDQKTGHWIIISPTDMYCFECNEIEHLDTSRRFCVYCGTEMVEPKESEVNNG